MASSTLSPTMHSSRWGGWRAGLSFVLPASLLLIFVGYMGAWVDHAAAGLVITGLDLAEYVKFLHPVRSGEIQIWRESFYLPLVMVSVTLSLFAYRRSLPYPWPLRVFLVLFALIAALNLLPPAWSPGILFTAEFRIQTFTLLTCAALALISPLLALLPQWTSTLVTVGLAALALWLPVAGFLRILPAIAELYGHPLGPGWGFWTMTVGLGISILVLLYEFWQQHKATA